MTPDIALRPAHLLADAIRCREVSSRELLDHYLARVERLNPPLNAVVTLDPEGARSVADAADAALARGEVGGPLHGVPMTIKDTYETAGMRTTCGVAAWDRVPDRDADAVQRLRGAGAGISQALLKSALDPIPALGSPERIGVDTQPMQQQILLVPKLSSGACGRGRVGGPGLSARHRSPAPAGFVPWPWWLQLRRH